MSIGCRVATVVSRPRYSRARYKSFEERACALLRGKRKPRLQTREDPHVLLVDERLYLAQPRVTFVGLFPAFEVARVVELEDDLELVVIVVAGPDDVGPKIARKILHGT